MSFKFYLLSLFPALSLSVFHFFLLIFSLSSFLSNANVAANNINIAGNSNIKEKRNKKIIYFSYFHSVITYGIIFRGNSADRDNVFKLQKRALLQIPATGIHVVDYLKN
jgi:hypothetical protein